MPRKFRNITETIRANPGDIIRYLDAVSTKHGNSCWFVRHPKSENRVCLVAHIDTIYKPPKNLFIVENVLKSGKNEGLGADDRAGVWALFKLYRMMPDREKPMLLFTDGEERGGIGAYEAVKILNEELKDVIFFVELDRQGKQDAVFYNSEPENFKKFIETFGFTRSWGSFSDITIIGRAFKKCCVNLSVGYHGQHSLNEELNLKYLYATIKKVASLLESNSGIRTVWENDYKPTQSYGNYGYGMVSNKYSNASTDWQNWSRQNPGGSYKKWKKERKEGRKNDKQILDYVFSGQDEVALLPAPVDGTVCVEEPMIVDISPEVHVIEEEGSEHELRQLEAPEIETQNLTWGKCQTCGQEEELIFNTCRHCAY